MYICIMTWAIAVQLQYIVHNISWHNKASVEVVRGGCAWRSCVVVQGAEAALERKKKCPGASGPASNLPYFVKP